jgi:predicted DsbA family dithiol-disulfide isomerase
MEDAINQTKSEYKFNISWHPFLLNDSIPEEGYDRKEYFKAKFGITDETKSPMFERLNQVGKENGINFSRGTVVPNTFKSHQLIKYAKEIGKQNEVLKIFFNFFFRLLKIFSKLILNKERILEVKKF